MKLRERIAEVLFDIGEYDEPIAESAHVDRIIAIVREALLQPEAVEAFYEATMFDDACANSIRRGMTAALAAMTAEGTD